MTRAEMLLKVEELRTLREKRLDLKERLVELERERRETKVALEREAKACLLALTEEHYGVEGNRKRAEDKARQDTRYLEQLQKVETAERTYQQEMDEVQRKLDRNGILLECIRWQLQIETTAATEELQRPELVEV